MLAHIFHLLSCFVLYQLSWKICDAQSVTRRRKFALIAACIHILSPAGLFLSAPYAESAFSFFNFTGFYCYIKSLDEQSRVEKRKFALLVLAAGLNFGIATILRSNGLLSGLVFLVGLVRETLEFRNITDWTSKISRLSALIGGGMLMAACAIVPQFLAYLRFCVDLDIHLRRQWCSKSVPSVYAWVQSYYW